MQRRAFIRLSLAGGMVAGALPQRLLAGTDSPSMAGGVYYTQDQPGRWKDKAGGHLPRIEKSLAADGTTRIQVTTKHPMNGYEHYIIKHQLLDQNYQFIAERMFNPNQDQPSSEYSLPAGYSGMVYALSMCNKHDLWLNGMRV